MSPGELARKENTALYELLGRRVRFFIFQLKMVQQAFFKFVSAIILLTFERQFTFHSYNLNNSLLAIKNHRIMLVYFQGFIFDVEVRYICFK